MFRKLILFAIVALVFAVPAQARHKPPFWHPAKRASTIKPSDKITIFQASPRAAQIMSTLTDGSWICPETPAGKIIVSAEVCFR